MKKIFLSLALVILTSPALAQSSAPQSPAVQLYVQAAKYVLDYFDGTVSEPLEKTVQLFRDDLSKICESDGLACPYVKGSVAVQRLVQSLRV